MSSSSKNLNKFLGILKPFKGEKRRTFIKSGHTGPQMFSKYDRNMENLEKYELYYRSEGTVWAAINSIAYNTVMSGYRIESTNPEAKKVIERFCINVDITKCLLMATKNALIYGDAFSELVYNKKKQLVRVKRIDPKTMFIDFDEFGDINHYYQELDGVKQPPLNLDEIWHLVLFDRADSPYGISLIEPSRDTISRKVKSDESIANSVERHGYPKYVLYAGEGDDQPSEEELDKIEKKFENLSHDNEFILSGNCKLTTVDDKGVQGVEEYFNYFQAQLVTGLLCPEEQLGLGAGPLHPDTEIFVKGKGFIPITEVNEGDEILAYNKESGEIEYQINKKNWKYVVDEELYHFKGRTYDLITTSNHRMYYRGQHKDDFSITTADNLPSRFEMKVGGFVWEGDDRDYEIIPQQEVYVGDKWHEGVTHQVVIQEEKYIPMDDWLEFLGYFLSEGYTSISKNGYVVGIRQYPGQSYEMIKECLLKLPFNINISNDRFTITNKQLALYLEKFGKSNEKFIPENIKSLPPHRLKILYDALMVGDGYQKNYFTSSKRLANDVQEILLKMGYGSTICVRDRVGENVYFNGNLTGKVNYLQYTVTRNECNLTPEVCIKKTKGHTVALNKESYNGYVHCVTVDSGLILARYNGKVVVTGNSTESTARVKEILFERMIKSFQHAIASSVERDIFSKVLKQNGFENEIVRIKFKSVTDYDEAMKARWLSDILKSYSGSKYRPFSINEIRDMFNVEPIDDEYANRHDIFKDNEKSDSEEEIEDDDDDEPK